MDVFTFINFKPLENKFKFNILEVKSFEHSQYDLFLMDEPYCYFYTKSSQDVIMGDYSGHFRWEFPKKIEFCQYSYRRSERQEKIRSLDCKINDEIILICCNHIFYLKLISKNGFRPLINVLDLNEKGFFEQFLSFAEKFVTQNKIKSNMPKKRKILNLKINVLKKSDGFGKDIPVDAYKIKKNISISNFKMELEKEYSKLKIVTVDKLGIFSMDEIQPNSKIINFEIVDTKFFWLLDEEGKSIEIKKITI